MSKPSSQLPWASYFYGIQCRLIQAAEQQYGDIVLSISKHAYPITLEITEGKEAALSGIWIQFVTEESVKLINVVLLPLGSCQLQKIVSNASAAFYPSLCFKEKRATCNPACWHTPRCIEEHTGNNVTSTGWATALLLSLQASLPYLSRAVSGEIQNLLHGLKGVHLAFPAWNKLLHEMIQKNVKLCFCPLQRLLCAISPKLVESRQHQMCLLEKMKA